MRRALELLGSRRSDAYETAMAALREETREWWADILARDPDELEEDDEPPTDDPKGLLRFSRPRRCRGSRPGRGNWPTGP